MDSSEYSITKNQIIVKKRRESPNQFYKKKFHYRYNFHFVINTKIEGFFSYQISKRLSPYINVSDVHDTQNQPSC